MKSLRILFIAVALVTVNASNLLANVPVVNQLDTVKTIQVKVKGITCSTDLKMIASNVEKVNGVISCKPGKEGATTTFSVEFDPTKVSEKEIYTAIEGTGSCENPEERPYKVKQ